MLETDRILLRPFELKDAKAVFEFGSDELVQRYTGEPPLASIKEAENIIRNGMMKEYETIGYGRWAAVYKPDQRVIGFAGLKYLPEIEETDLGFRFLSEYWNKGLATECANALINYGLNDLNLHQIIAIAMKENVASNKVLAKIGMKLYKTGEYDGDGQNHNWYRILADDLKQQSQPF